MESKFNNNNLEYKALNANRNYFAQTRIFLLIVEVLKVIYSIEIMCISLSRNVIRRLRIFIQIPCFGVRI